jgi:hypothetical protein
MGRSPRELTPEQVRNRARLMIAARVVAAFFAISAAISLFDGLAQGYFKMGVGEGRGMSRDYVILDTPFGRTVASLFYQVIAVFFGLFAIAPRYATRVRVWAPSFAVVVLVNFIVAIFYR